MHLKWMIQYESSFYMLSNTVNGIFSEKLDIYV